jgi:hypothetical protein
MRERDPRERAKQGLDAALSRFGRERARLEERGAEPWPGDLFVLPETADWPVEWLLVERAREGRCRVVAADAHPVLGCADVAIGPEAEGGPLSVRSAVGLWLGVESLRRAERTGALAADDLDRVRRKRAELDAGRLADPRLGQEGEPDPDYEDWLDEVLIPARSALSPAAPQEAAPGHRWVWPGVALAAALLLLLALGGVSVLAWRYHQGESAARQEIRRLQAERRKLEVVHRGQLESERQSLLAAHQRELAALKAAETRHLAAPPAPRRPPLELLANLAYASFYPGESRGTVRELSLPASVTYLFAVFYIGQQPLYPEYRLEVAGRTGTPAWSVPGLRPLPSQEVSVALPRAQLPEGPYVLRLYGLRSGKSTSVGEYEVRIRSPRDETPDR